MVFNVGSKDVTLFDPQANTVTATRPVDAAVRWLSNEQRYFDGRHIWTYDFPAGEVQAIAIDPDSFDVARRVPTGGKAPGHSLVLTPDLRRGFVNSAGSDFVAAIDPRRGTVTGTLQTGAFP